tara:strand:+ start:1296 stop:2042 length:747 start_codon:yes stop_codon:yes gene_type:complete
MKYKIAIPSYKRSKSIRERTLNYLINICNISPKIINVFVANKKEYEDYKYLKEIGINIIIGVKLLHKQRNFIQNFYNDGDFIMQFDDDIDSLKIKKGKETKVLTDLDSIIRIGFNESLKNKTKLFGVGAVDNHFFMNNKISTNLKLIVGSCFGLIIDKDKSLSLTLEEKEDYERTIKHFLKFGKVVRLNMIATKTTYYTGAGGMVDNRTEEEQNKSALYLCKKYPNLIKLNTNRKSKYLELRLNNRAI